MLVPLHEIFQENLGFRTSMPTGFFLCSTVRSFTVRSWAKIPAEIIRSSKDKLNVFILVKVFVQQVKIIKNVRIKKQIMRLFLTIKFLNCNSN